MKFKIAEVFYVKQKWVVTLVNDNGFIHTCGNFELADLLDMSVEEYKSLMVKHGATRIQSKAQFLNKESAQKFVDYLNDRYLVILKLGGDI